jgi:hypothetical protein
VLTCAQSEANLGLGEILSKIWHKFAANDLFLSEKFEMHGPETNRNHILYALSIQFIQKSADH